jgi:hypothetical protein
MRISNFFLWSFVALLEINDVVVYLLKYSLIIKYKNILTFAL